MFSKQSAAQEFRSRSSTAIETLPPEQSFQLLLDFYETDRATTAYSMSEDGDMVLFQYGTFDWGEGKQFNLNLTRQIIYPEEDDPDEDYPDEDQGQEIWQLGLTYFYQPSDNLLALGSGEFWVHNLEKLPEARPKILTSPALLQCKPLPVISVDLDWRQQ